MEVSVEKACYVVFEPNLVQIKIIKGQTSRWMCTITIDRVSQRKKALRLSLKKSLESREDVIRKITDFLTTAVYKIESMKDTVTCSGAVTDYESIKRVAEVLKTRNEINLQEAGKEVDAAT